MSIITNKEIITDGLGDISRIPDEPYVLYGTGEFARRLVQYLRSAGKRTPDIILADTPEIDDLETIPIHDLALFMPGTLAVVLGSPIYQAQMRNTIIRSTKGYNKLIDLFTPSPKHDHKVFGIGYGKTGTTSLRRALQELGYVIGNQPDAEMLFFDWAQNDSDKIIDYCKTADAFQDSPFCCDGMYEPLDAMFPNSKFILTVRDTPEQWFESLVRFHTKLFSSDKQNPPTQSDLQHATYRCQGFVHDAHCLMFNESHLYEKARYIEQYKCHIDAVQKYFGHRQNDLLILNVSRADAYKCLCQFLEKPIRNKTFPWLNKTEDKSTVLTY